ncbi:MAG: DsrE family protein [Bacteroidia bacterium]|nr:DsrE family protein [Bacteroidia bacterium]
MKYVSFLMWMLLPLALLRAQTTPAADAAVHRIVYQMTSSDSVVHKAFIRQLGNVTSTAPTAQIEVVCHGPGLDLLVRSNTTVAKGIAEMSGKGVVFVACEFTMRQRSLTKEALVPQAGTVESAILEIVKKQEAGWSYIKAGF